MRTTDAILTAAAAVKSTAALLSTEQKNRALFSMADELEAGADAILAANRADVEAARGVISDVMIDRLSLTPARIAGMAEGMRAVATPSGGGVDNLKDGSVRHFSSVSTEYETLDRLVGDLPELRLNFDPANLFVLGKDLVDFYRRYRERIAYAHLKEFRPFGQGWTPSACGSGSMDWGGLLREMRSFEGPAMLEYEIPADAEQGFSASLDFLRKEEKKLGS